MAFNPTLRHLTTRLDGGVVWAPSTEYLADNIVIYLDASYRCLVNHTSGSSFVTDLLANRWVKLSASVINYIANSSALVDTSGYSTYADAAGAAPVDGTGGSPSVTFTRSTTTPLRGIADFNFTKDAANRQGQGVATDITIDLADQAKVLTVTFDYEVLSGTYATGDLTVYLIADPSGTPVVIQPAGYTVQSATVGTTMRQIATFQTQATGQSYRVCFHVASTSASAYVLAIDNVICGPQSTVQGAAISDWVNYTPTGSWTGNVSYVGKWRRVGDQIEVVATVTCIGGAPTPSANLSINLPAGYFTDASKVQGNQRIGTTYVEDFGTVGYEGSAYLAGSNGIGAALISTGGPVGTSGPAVSNTAPFTFAANDYVTVTARLPIQCWSSNTVMSNDTDTRVIATRATAALPTGTIASTFAGSTAVVFSGTSYDLSGSYSTSTGVFTVPVSGVYKISASTRISGTLAAGSSFSAIAITKNGVEYSNVGLTFSTSTGAGTLNSFGSDAVSCVAGDLITIRVVSNATTPIFTSDSTKNFLEISRLSGPATIAASETVAAHYRRTTADGNQSLSSGSSVVYFTGYYPSKVIDTHNFVTSSASDTYATIPVSGVYEIVLTNRFDTSAGTETFQSYIMSGGTNQTGTLTIDGTQLAACITQLNTVGTSGTAVYCGRFNAGDIVRFKMLRYAAVTTLMIGANFSGFTIKRVGN